MQGFYNVFWTGDDEFGAFGVLLHQGRIYAIDREGGEFTGTYKERGDGGADVALTYTPVPSIGTNGQPSIDPPINADFLLSASTFAGGYQEVNLPTGKFNVKLVKRVTV